MRFKKKKSSREKRALAIGEKLFRAECGSAVESFMIEEYGIARDHDEPIDRYIARCLGMSVKTFTAVYVALHENASTMANNPEAITNEICAKHGVSFGDLQNVVSVFGVMVDRGKTIGAGLLNPPPKPN